MPKEVISAAEILGNTAPVTEAEIPVVETAAPSTEAPPAPAAGFEDPPVDEAPSAAAVLDEAAQAEEPPDVEAEKLAKIEFDAGAALAREGQPLPDGASDKAKEGYLSVAPVLAGKSVEVAAVPKPEASAPAAKCWVFVKNIHPGEVIKFKDGTDFVFPRSQFNVSDPVLAEKILAVADRHHIVLQ